jgi:hypothetical protein
VHDGRVKLDPVESQRQDETPSTASPETPARTPEPEKLVEKERDAASEYLRLLRLV